MSGFRHLLKDEPVLLQQLFQSAIIMAVMFGLNWSDEQQGAVLVFTGLLLAVLARSMVTPVASVEAKVERAVDKERVQQAALSAEELMTLAELRTERDRLQSQVRHRQVRDTSERTDEHLHTVRRTR